MLLRCVVSTKKAGNFPCFGRNITSLILRENECFGSILIVRVAGGGITWRLRRYKGGDAAGN